MTQLDIQRWSEETAVIHEQARQALVDSPTEAVRHLQERLPAGADALLSLAFAGQYSAGKSTLISALTGRDDIAIGASITTEQTHRYPWEGVVIIDTPGIHTSIRPDHDDTAYDAIAGADLLVFVITNELFDEHIAGYYHKLTVGHDKGHETILVVNKMGRHADGNTAESRAVVTEDLRAPLAPFTPEGLKITFTDAADALEAWKEEDPEFRAMLEDQGNLSDLVANINAFVAEKELTARHTTMLYQIERILEDAIAAEPTDHPDLDALVLVYNQNARSIRDAVAEIRGAVGTAIFDAEAAVKRAGSDLAESYYPGVSGDEVDQAVERAQQSVDQIGVELGQRIQQAFVDVIPHIGQQIHSIRTGDLYQRTMTSIGHRAGQRNLSAALQAAEQGSQLLGDLATRFALNSAAVAQGASGMARFSGSAAHAAVLNIGHFFGHSFRPWEAVRYAGFIGRAAPVLSILGVAVSIGTQILADHQEQKRSEQAQQLRRQVVTEFDQAAEHMGREARAQSESAVQELLIEPLRELEQHRAQLDDLRQERNASLSRLRSVRDDTSRLIKRIHSKP